MALAVWACAACGAPRLLPDGGPENPPTDSGALDAGSRDAGRSDAGTSDAGSVDAGSVDAGNPTALKPAVSCTDPVAQVYVTPAGLPALTPASQGDVVRCGYDQDLSQSALQTEVTAKGIVTPMVSGAGMY